MLSKYAPFYCEWGEAGTIFFKSRLEGFIFFFALGLLAGFCLPVSLYFGVAGIGLFGLFMYFKKWLKMSFFLLILSAFLLGIGWANLRVKMVAHPTLTQPIFQVSFSGTIDADLVLPDKQVLVISGIRWPWPDVHLPTKVQLNFLAPEPIFKTGDKVKVQASLFPLKFKAEPFAFQTPAPKYFEEIGAFGHVQEITLLSPTNRPPSFFQKIRENLAVHLLEILPENQARIAIPLITGEQRFVSPEQYRLYRQAGITHVLSVSGFHMALLAGFLFFLMRGLCAWISVLTLRINAKKVAAVLAWFGTLFYLLLSGAQVPALRSFGMISLVFLGIFVDRIAFSKRSLFLVALALLIYRPENILSISFQLSFLSVLILITVHEFCQTKLKDKSKFVRIFCEFLLLNLTITLALMPLIAGYFHLLNPYAFLGNLMFSTLFSFAVMPCLFVGCLLYPIGSGGLFFKMAGYLLDKVALLSGQIADFPFSEILLPFFPIESVSLFCFALILFCAFQKWGKVLAFFLLFWAIGIIVCFKTADLFVFNHTFLWVKDGVIFENSEGQKWLQSRWQKALGATGAIDRPQPDFVWIKNQKLALKGTGCVGAKGALFFVPDSRCHAPIFLLKPDTFYQVYFDDQKIKIQENQNSIKTITP